MESNLSIIEKVFLGIVWLVEGEPHTYNKTRLVGLIEFGGMELFGTKHHDVATIELEVHGRSRKSLCFHQAPFIIGRILPPGLWIETEAIAGKDSANAAPEIHCIPRVMIPGVLMNSVESNLSRAYELLGRLELGLMVSHHIKREVDSDIRLCLRVEDILHSEEGIGDPRHHIESERRNERLEMQVEVLEVVWLQNPMRVLKALLLNTTRLRFAKEAFHSLEYGPIDRFFQAKVLKALTEDNHLSPPDSTAQITGLNARGSVELQFLEDERRRVDRIPGVKEVRLTEVRVEERLVALKIQGSCL